MVVRGSRIGTFLTSVIVATHKNASIVRRCGGARLYSASRIALVEPSQARGGVPDAPANVTEVVPAEGLPLTAPLLVPPAAPIPMLEPLLIFMVVDIGPLPRKVTLLRL